MSLRDRLRAASQGAAPPPLPPPEPRKTQAELALDLADEMKARAGQYRQMGFPDLARWLDRNADAARLWAATRHGNT